MGGDPLPVPPPPRPIVRPLDKLDLRVTPRPGTIGAMSPLTLHLTAFAAELRTLRIIHRNALAEARRLRETGQLWPTIRRDVATYFAR